MVSTDSIPVGFRSFSQDVFAEDGGNMKGVSAPHEISFAKEEVEYVDAPSPKTREELVLNEIQNRGSLGVDD